MLERIGVIDDDKRIHTSLGLALDKYEIINLYSAAEAIEYFKKPNLVNLTLLDVYLKEDSGLKVLAELKKLRPDLSVIMMTGFGSKEVVVEALRLHADDYLEKPLNVEELRTKVKRILEAKNETLSPVRKETNGEQMKRFIRKNYNNISLTDISSEMKLSPKYISRLFKEKNLVRYRDYKVNIKIEQAKKLLGESSYDISRISDQLGYQNPESFMRIFKKMTGQTPTQYRRIIWGQSETS